MQYPIPVQLRLLDLAALDRELAQVSHRLRTAPLAARANDVAEQVASVHRQVVTARTQIEDLDRKIARSEDELTKVKARLARDRELADQGVSAKVQRELQHELTSLTRRLSDLEDAELELMEQQENLGEQVSSLQAKEAELAATLGTARGERDEAQAQNSARHTELAERRAATVRDLPDDLVRMYETARRAGSAGAAHLVGNQCTGCRIELTASDVARLRAAPPEQIETCEECGCVIVRAPAV